MNAMKVTENEMWDLAQIDWTIEEYPDEFAVTPSSTAVYGMAMSEEPPANPLGDGAFTIKMSRFAAPLLAQLCQLAQAQIENTELELHDGCVVEDDMYEFCSLYAQAEGFIAGIRAASGLRLP
jgi:hypothetical protein